MAAGQGVPGEGYRLGPRVPFALNDVLQGPTLLVGRDVPNRILQARSSATTTNCHGDENLCEKPEGGSSMAVPIVLGVVIPLAAIISVLIYLHRRNVKKMRKEDTMDPHKSLDFGLAMNAQRPTAKAKRKSSFFGGEKDLFNPKHRQLSMDMNLSSPYLLPPEVHNSRESLNSLARTLHQNEDPYRPVAQYTASDAGSMRSFQKDQHDSASIYTASGTATGMRSPPLRPNRLSHLSAAAAPHSPGLRSPGPPPYPENGGTSPAQFPMPSAPPPVKESFILEPIVPVIEDASEGMPKREMAGELDGGFHSSVAELQAPEPTASKVSRKGLPGQNAQPPLNHRATTDTVDEPFIYDKPNGGLRQDSSTYGDFDLKLDAPDRNEAHGAQGSASLPVLALGGSFDDETFLPGQATTSDEPTIPNVGLPSDRPPFEEDRGRALHRRRSSEYPQDDEEQPSGLGLPQFDTRRLSVGFRPLPPDEVMESEDPETRANRIRSFYKEYFDDGKPDLAEYNQHYPPQGMAPGRQGAGTGPGPGAGPGANRNGGGQYYEDYDRSYHAGEANAYFDPQSNSFVMPYAQPVSRRAMTPPPSGSRFPGGRPHGGPRNFHGSMGGMSMGGGRGMSRPGSSFSNGTGPRPGSSVSNRMMGGPRSGSKMSGRSGPHKPMPPPEDLITLPTPSKLRDDSFALLGAIDFAPPPTYRDQATGRPQSPLGERRPFQMKVPISSPLVSAFDEMAALPSPHLLRKSSTFTGLDFAPPRKFKDADTMSDAGSIRSNRSGISAAQQAAIRNGAGRVSRLPADTVFTQASLADQLKPSWDLNR
ncbi:hypothetical protein SPI_01819 [Niveomyces insectorum RCEF 264]|uniref:Uncharacterized protein n=1 Tax=Niveomyces insectorum RCEF 264 TaxID=1081102 RepID=A0A167Z9F7_9HYPO|nr:hypothetical protein SPI_01819 [Niveomyces insectorum RCEF 264]